MQRRWIRSGGCMVLKAKKRTVTTAAPPPKKVLKARIQPRVRIESSPEDIVEQAIKEMHWAQSIRWLHHDDARRVFAAMPDDRWDLYMRRLKQIIAIEES